MSITAPDPGKVRRPLFRFPLRFTVAAALVLLFCLATVEGFGWLTLHHWLGRPDLQAMFPMDADRIAIVWTIPVLFYAFARCGRFHPGLWKAYAEWLSTTPWRPGRPLPVGPPHVVWEDLVPAIAVAIWCPRPVFPLLAFVACFVFLTIRISVGGRDGKWFAGVAASLVAGVILIWPLDRAAEILAAVLLLLCDVVIRRSLRELPWIAPVVDVERKKRATLASSKWPMAPLPRKVPIRPLVGCAAAGVIAWCVFCVGTAAMRGDRETRSDFLLFTGLLLLFAPLVRWIGYCGQFQPPISTWGRIWTLRWVIPSYDYVLIAPLAAAGLAVVVPLGCWYAGCGLPVAMAAGAFADFAVVLNAGPTLSRWQLTGGHRIMIRRRPARKSAEPPGE